MICSIVQYSNTSPVPHRSVIETHCALFPSVQIKAFPQSLGPPPSLYTSVWALVFIFGGGANRFLPAPLFLYSL